MFAFHHQGNAQVTVNRGDFIVFPLAAVLAPDFFFSRTRGPCQRFDGLVGPLLLGGDVGQERMDQDQSGCTADDRQALFLRLCVAAAAVQLIGLVHPRRQPRAEILGIFTVGVEIGPT